MKIVTIKKDLIIDDFDILVNNTTDGNYDKKKVIDYLNHKLYTDPEYFGDFTEQNIIDIYEGC